MPNSPSRFANILIGESLRAVIDPETPLGQIWTAPYACKSSAILSVEGTPIDMELPALFELPQKQLTRR